MHPDIVLCAIAKQLGLEPDKYQNWSLLHDVLSMKIDELKEQLETANKLIADVAEELLDAPELNPCNYDHDQVCRLSTQCSYVCTLLVEYDQGVQ